MTVRAIVYTADGVDDYDDIDAAMRAQGTTWLRVSDPTEDELEAVREAAGIHPLAIEDVQSNVRPKLEEFDTHTFVLLKEARLTCGDSTFEEELWEEPVGVFFGQDWLVTVASDEPDAVERVWATVHGSDARVLGRGPDFAAYRIVDYLVDGYFGVLDDIEDRIEIIEDEVVEDPDRETLVEINNARRELLSTRKLLWPSREAVGVLARGDPEEVRDATEKYYRDVYDHLVQLVDLVETYRDLASGARDIYLNALSVSTNEVMKRLTVVATIILPLTFIVGVYGMNMPIPELEWANSYFAVMGGMGAVALILLVYFRREGWL